jgi:preprotein translocase SecE subunit
MNWAQELVKLISGLELSAELSYIYLVFISVVVGFLIWAYYYAVFGGALKELGKITWFSLKSTAVYTVLTVFTIVIVGALLFGYDYLLDQLVNIIITNANA